MTESGCHPYTLKDILTKEQQEEVLNLNLGYGQTNGDAGLRKAISRLYEGFGEENVMLTNGSSEANYCVLHSRLKRHAPINNG
jgi:aspartate/methionine/tyrosine aminotransferase